MKSKDDILIVKQPCHRFYVCDACGMDCYFCVTNDYSSLPPPRCCPYNYPGMEGYDDELPQPNWRIAQQEKRS